MTKDQQDDPHNASHRTPSALEPNPKSSGESHGAKSKPPTIHQEIYRMFQLERVDRAYGAYPPSLRNRGNIEPLDELLGFDGNDAEGAESPKPDEHSEDPNNASQSSERKRK